MHKGGCLSLLVRACHIHYIKSEGKPGCAVLSLMWYSTLKKLGRKPLIVKLPCHSSSLSSPGGRGEGSGKGIALPWGPPISKSQSRRREEDFCWTLFRKKKEGRKVEKAKLQLNKEVFSGCFLSDQG